MPRIVFLLGVSLSLVAGAFLLADALLWPPGVTEANARRLRVGMTLAQVEAVLGGPPSRYLMWPHRRSWPTPGRQSKEDGVWPTDRTETAGVLVSFDEDGRVERLEWSSSRPAPPSLLDRLRAWLGL